MLIYVNGCSHTIGLGKYSWSYAMGKSICQNISYRANKGLVDVSHLEFNTNDNVVHNFSDSGKGNDMIFHETIEFLSNCKLNNIKPDYVFVQWSGPSRYTIQDGYDNIRFCNPGNTKDEFLNFDPFASRETLSYIFSLQEILKNMDIEYYFCCYMELDKNCGNLSVYNNIDIDKFIKFDDNTHPIFGGFRNKMRQFGYIVDAAGHPSYYGHWYIANKFLEKLKVDNLDIGFFNEIKPIIENDKFFLPKTDNYADLVGHYNDNMITKNKAMELAKNNLLKDGSEEEKNSIRNTVF